MKAFSSLSLAMVKDSGTAVNSLCDGDVAASANLGAGTTPPKYAVRQKPVEETAFEPIQHLTPGILSWGVSTAALGTRILETLSAVGVETHLVLSKWARATIEVETDYSVRQVHSLADHVYGSHDQATSISSGSFRTDGMVVAPCGMKTLTAIRVGYGEGLIARAADVTLKERRKLALVPRGAAARGEAARRHGLPPPIGERRAHTSFAASYPEDLQRQVVENWA